MGGMENEVKNRKAPHPCRVRGFPVYGPLRSGGAGCARLTADVFCFLPQTCFLFLACPILTFLPLIMLSLTAPITRSARSDGTSMKLNVS